MPTDMEAFEGQPCGATCVGYVCMRLKGAAGSPSEIRDCIGFTGDSSNASLLSLKDCIEGRLGFDTFACKSSLWTLEHTYGDFVAVAHAKQAESGDGHFVVVEKTGRDCKVVDYPKQTVYAGAAEDWRALEAIERQYHLTGAYLLVSREPIHEVRGNVPLAAGIGAGVALIVLALAAWWFRRRLGFGCGRSRPVAVTGSREQA